MVMARFWARDVPFNQGSGSPCHATHLRLASYPASELAHSKVTSRRGAEYITISPLLPRMIPDAVQTVVVVSQMQ